MAGKFAQFVRKLSTNSALRASMSEPLSTSAGHDPHHGSWKIWRNLFFIVCCPALALCMLNVMIAEEPKRPEFVKYSYMRIRNRKYPWRDGVKTLFHNPHYNALPDGYEDELEGGHH